MLYTPLAALAEELPHIAGRGRVLGSGSRVADCAIECNNEGIDLATASAPQVRWAERLQAWAAGHCFCLP